MIVEYIRYTVDEARAQDFIDAYKKASEPLIESPHCTSFDLSRCVDDPTQFILRLEWTSADNHMKGFRGSDEFRRFFALVKPYYDDIQEMRHYERLLDRPSGLERLTEPIWACGVGGHDPGLTHDLMQRRGGA